MTAQSININPTTLFHVSNTIFLCPSTIFTSMNYRYINIHMPFLHLLMEYIITDKQEIGEAARPNITGLKALFFLSIPAYLDTLFLA